MVKPSAVSATPWPSGQAEETTRTPFFHSASVTIGLTEPAAWQTSFKSGQAARISASMPVLPHEVMATGRARDGFDDVLLAGGAFVDDDLAERFQPRDRLVADDHIARAAVHNQRDFFHM